MQTSTLLTTKGMLLLTSLMLLLLHPGSAQQQQPVFTSSTHRTSANAWLMFLSDTRLSERWGLHAEAQVLRSQTSELGLQNVWRAGVNYYLVDALMLTGGYAYSRSFLDAGYVLPVSAPEHRIYQQIQLQDSKSRVKFQHRYRLEQRWVQFTPGQDYTYLNRMRYQLRLAMPLQGRELIGGVPFVVVSNELFLGFGRNETNGLIQQNRAYVGVGYQITKAASLEAGYLNQMVLQRKESQFELNENILLSLCFSPDFRRGKLDAQPY